MVIALGDALAKKPVSRRFQEEPIGLSLSGDFQFMQKVTAPGVH
ncbi:MAG TPA: hypothetical protein V6D03_16545 [Candidatus Caenarcaniphilales bacterium]